MAKQTYVTNLDHTSDAAFRAWGLELSNALQAAGLTKTSDTGQINFASVTRPAANNAGGYEIYRFNDSLQATSPVFIKIEYGTANSAAVPAIWITVGNGSNGAGLITGVSSTRVSTHINAAPTSLVATYVTNICVVDGHVGVAWKLGAQGANIKGQAMFAVSRGPDDTGALTGDYVRVYRCNTSSAAQSCVQVVDFANVTTYTESTDGSHCVVPQNPTSSLVGANAQVYKHYVHTPRVRPDWALLTVLNSEFGSNTQFSTIPVGSSVSHTYICLGSNHSYASIGQTTGSVLCMLWE